MKPKNNKATGDGSITAEILKHEGNIIVVQCLHELLTAIWKKEKMPVEWHTGVIHPVFKKGNKTLYENYRPLTLHNLAYIVFSTVLAVRLEPFVEDIVGDYQCGLRRNRSTL